MDLLRKLRFQLATDKKLSNDLIFAIGEIILIVAGIFSSIDDWLQNDLIEILELKENYYSIREDINTYVRSIHCQVHC